MSVADYYESAKENWRILLLTLFLLVSTVALVPTGSSGGSAEGVTNLEYGLELSGGTRVRAPFVGYVVSDLDYTAVDASPAEIERSVAGDLGLEETEVQARPESGHFEVYTENVSRSEFAAAVSGAGFDVGEGDVREGVAPQTRQTAVQVIDTKLRESPEFSGGRVQITTTPGGDNFMVVEVPGASRDEVIGLLSERGVVSVVARYPADSGDGTEYRNTTIFTQSALASVGTADEDAQGPHVPVTLDEESAREFSGAMQEFGFTGEGAGRCNYRQNPEQPGWCLLTVRDGEVVYSASLGPGLAADMENGEFGGSFRMNTRSMDEARDLRIALQAGALPTDLDLEEGTSTFLQPSTAERFKLFSLVTGIFAALAVALVIYGRYRDARVAAPMTLTALSEVYILLGFAAAIHLPLDLAHIAGFIAVIGTGVDDLVIIADEVLEQGDVRTTRVFRSRFRKALWIILAAAVTTIVAMSPLTVLSLGDLSGFAIVTIVGVIIGVGVTRPAYGDILRALITR